MMRENEIVLCEIAFSDRNYNLSSSALRSIQNASSSAETLEEKNANSTLAKHTHKEREREREREKKKENNAKENNNAPVYCSTSDFTHPFNPSSNVSKNAAPSTSRLAFADDANAATVVAQHAIVFFKPLLLLFLPRLLPFVVFAMMMMIDDDEMMCRFS